MRHVLFSLPGESTRILVRGRTNWQYVVSVFVCLLCATSGGSAHGLQHARAPTFAASENAALLGIARESDADVYGMGRVCGCQALQDCEDAAFAERKTGAEDDITGSVLRGGSGESDLVGQDGRIEMIIGPMFAGKSTELMRRIRRHRIAGRKCIVIKYAKDQRHGEAIDELATHDNNRILARPCSKLQDAFEEMKEADVVGIDEAQFYPDLVEVCDSLADLGVVVILSALDGTFRREPFGPVLNLMPRAERITKLSAVCKICCNEASFTRRTTDDTALEAIGGAEMYMPTCRRCFAAPLTGRDS